MVIFVDQDNVLNDFTTGFILYLNELYGLDIKLEKENCKKYSILENINNIGPEVIYEPVFNAEGFWYFLKPLEGSIEVMELLCKKHEVYIVTSPWKSSPICIPEKIAWTKKHLPFFDIDNIIFCNNKSLLHGDVIIDDAPHYIKNNNCKKTIIYDYPYNRDIASDCRVNSWEDIKVEFQV